MMDAAARIMAAIEADDEAVAARSAVIGAILAGDTATMARAALAGADAVLAAEPTLVLDLDRLGLARYIVSQAMALAGRAPAAHLDLVVGRPLDG